MAPISPLDESWPDEVLFKPLVYDINLHIMDILDIDALVRVRRTSHLGDSFVAVALRRRMRAVLGPTMDDKLFRSFWGWFDELRVVVTGEAALHVLFPLTIPLPAQVDLYLPTKNYDLFMLKLTRQYGFEEETMPEPAPREQGSTQLPRVNLHKRLRPEDLLRIKRVRNGCIVYHVHECSELGTLHAIAGQWNTALQNFISAHTFCAAFPTLTARRRAILTPAMFPGNPNGMPRWLDEERARLGEHGWELARRAAYWGVGGECLGGRRAACATTMRYFGDRDCTRGVLGVLGSETGQAPLGVVGRRETVVWWLGGSRCPGNCRDGPDECAPSRRLTAWSLLYIS
ncbi:hypothetical protein C8Q76DRAFT_800567 [Earliella scabrosa]|nr:hypothetical protein C8Q76DRAFT_800818 [Earliella scabrosa]KAI0707219.1 hypothetical protein C8Q76DRAFT_800567 [Earliella scabrosa]